MAYVADEQTQQRKIRAARMAAASAVGNGVDPDVVRAAVEEGIREAIALAGSAPAVPPATAPRATSSTSALDTWAA